MIRTFPAALSALALAGCGFFGRSAPPEAPLPSELTGTVGWRERIALPPDAQLRVRLEEVPRGDEPPQFIAETTIPRIGPPPIRFRIALDPRVIDSRRAYTLTARIEAGERLMLVSNPPMRVITGGNPSRVDVLVSPAGGRR